MDRGGAKSDKPTCSVSRVRALRCREKDKRSGTQALNADMEGNVSGEAARVLSSAQRTQTREH